VGVTVRWWWWWCWAFCAAAAWCGCSLALDFPVPRESAPQDCANGIDDDNDGLVDCEDRDCLGSCPENVGERCSNGLDDDGDGLVDVQEPTCWSFAEVLVERCSSRGTPPVDVTEPSFVELNGSARVVTVDGRRAFDLEEAGRYLELASEGDANLVLAFSAAFPVVGSTLSVQAEGPDDLRGGIALGRRSDVSIRLVITGSSPPIARSTAPVGSDWIRVEVTVEAGRFTDVRVRDERTGDDLLDPPALEGPIEPLPWGRAPSLLWRFALSAGERALIDDIQLERAPFDPCGYRVPQLGARLAGLADAGPCEDPECAWRVLGAASDGVRRCALLTPDRRDGFEPGLWYAWSPTDDLGSWTAGRVVDDGRETGVDLSGGVPVAAVVTHLPDVGFRAVVQVASVFGTVDGVWLASADCVDWTAGLLPDELTRLPSGELHAPAALGKADDGRSRVVFYVGATPLAEDTRWFTADVDPATPTFGPPTPLDLPSLAGLDAGFAPPGAGVGVSSGTELLIVLPSRGRSPRSPLDGQLVLLVSGAGAASASTVTLLGPSRRPGEFDAARVRRGALALDPRPAAGETWTGALFYDGGGSDVGVVELGFRSRF